MSEPNGSAKPINDAIRAYRADLGLQSFDTLALHPQNSRLGSFIWWWLPRNGYDLVPHGEIQRLRAENDDLRAERDSLNEALRDTGARAQDAEHEAYERWQAMQEFGR